jgi:hypothetical protein
MREMRDVKQTSLRHLASANSSLLTRQRARRMVVQPHEIMHPFFICALSKASTCAPQSAQSSCDAHTMRQMIISTSRGIPAKLLPTSRRPSATQQITRLTTALIAGSDSAGKSDGASFRAN